MIKTLTEAKKLVLKAAEIQKLEKELKQIKEDLKAFAKAKKITSIKAGKVTAVIEDHSMPGKVDVDLLKASTTEEEYQSTLVPNLTLVRKLKLSNEADVIKSEIKGFAKISFKTIK